jgi:hypothetical protein
VDWRQRLWVDSIRSAQPDFDLLYYVSLHPAFPPEYDLPGLVAVTFRLLQRTQGGHLFVTALDPAAAIMLGRRLGLGPSEAIAMVDSHERVHVELQLANVAQEDEERASVFVDAVWLSLRHPRAAHLLEDRDVVIVVRVGPDFWERLVDPAQES